MFWLKILFRGAFMHRATTLGKAHHHYIHVLTAWFQPQRAVPDHAAPSNPPLTGGHPLPNGLAPLGSTSELCFKPLSTFWTEYTHHLIPARTFEMSHVRTQATYYCPTSTPHQRALVCFRTKPSPHDPTSALATPPSDQGGWPREKLPLVF